MPLSFTDSHCHLADEAFRADLTEVLAAMAAAHVTRALCVSVTLEDAPRVKAVAARQEGLWATVGKHPEEEGAEPTVAALMAAAADGKVVAIGETGLDYYQLAERKGGRSIAELGAQRERFRVHIRAARAARLPLVIHTRAAADDTLRILDEEGEDGGSASAGGVFHCFTETLEVARAALERGFYISFSGIVTFKNARELQALAPYIPDDRFLIETDSPYLAPVPYRGKRNTPAYVPQVAAQLAQLRGVSVERIAALSNANFDRLFLNGASA